MDPLSATSIRGDRLPYSPFHSPSKALRLSTPVRPRIRIPPSTVGVSVRVSASSNSDRNPLKSAAAGAIILSATATATALLSFKLSPLPARAEPAATTEVESNPTTDTDPSAALSEFLESSSSAADSVRSLVYQKLNDGADAEALALLRRIISARPGEHEWKLLAARLLNEMGEPDESRRLLEEILAADPLSFEALFENAVLMDRLGEGPAVIDRLEQALELALSENKDKAARDVRLIMAQVQYLQKNVEEALKGYEELAKEDPSDYRPYFCQGVIYSMLEKNKEAREKFAKYHELAPKKFEVDAYLQTPLSRVRMLGTGADES